MTKPTTALFVGTEFCCVLTANRLPAHNAGGTIDFRIDAEWTPSVPHEMTIDEQTRFEADCIEFARWIGKALDRNQCELIFRGLSQPIPVTFPPNWRRLPVDQDEVA